jgi:hypothetical protein
MNCSSGSAANPSKRSARASSGGDRSPRDRALAVVLLWPYYNLTFRFDWRQNGCIVRRLREARQLALILLLFEIVAWLVSVAHKRVESPRSVISEPKEARRVVVENVPALGRGQKRRRIGGLHRHTDRLGPVHLVRAKH